MIRIKDRKERSSCWRLRNHCRRRGFTLIETVVSASLLLVVMSFVATVTIQINAVWRDVGHQRIAMNELANQLDALTTLSESELKDSIDSLRPSAVAVRTLQDARLTGELVKDAWGTRVVLRLAWRARQPGRQVELSAWLVPFEMVETKEPS